MSDTPTPPPSSFSRGLLVVVACLAAYGLFWIVGRPLLPAKVLADQTAGLLPTLVTAAAGASLFRHWHRAPLWGFGITLAVLAVFTALMLVIF